MNIEKKNRDELRAELKAIIEQAGPQAAWRSILDDKGKLLAAGKEDMRDGHPDYFAEIDYSGKSVLDVGCSFGFYSFFAKDLGASRVLGVDPCEPAIRACEILRDLGSMEGIDFLAKDFRDIEPNRTFDVVMAINFIGKAKVLKGAGDILEALSCRCGQTLIISLAHAYHLDTHLNTDEKTVRTIYPNARIESGWFYVAETAAGLMGSGWRMERLSPAFDDWRVKRTFAFHRVHEYL